MAQTIPFQSDQYFSRSWKMLTRDKGWLKPVLLLAVGSLVPILGFLVVTVIFVVQLVRLFRKY